MNERIKGTLRDVVALFIGGEFEKLEMLSGGIRLSAAQMRDAVSEYGRTLVFPPDDAFNRLDIVQVSGREPSEYSVRFSFWTEEEGRSDLSLDLTFIEQDSERMRVEIDGVLVF